MLLTIVRHGESEWNRLNLYQGQQDSALSELGTRQVAALGAALRTASFDVIYTSPLRRAADTAAAVHAHHPQVPLHRESALLEISHGDWEGRPAAEIARDFPAELAEWKQRPTRSQMPNGESFSNVLKRVLDFREELQRRHHGRRVLLATHDVICKVLIADALAMPMDRINRIWVANTSVTRIDYRDDPPYLIALADAAHLAELAVDHTQQQGL
jgi:broad specificity phosphatase PhoE